MEGEEIALQPAFDVSRGFGSPRLGSLCSAPAERCGAAADPFENFVSRNLEIRYQA